MTNKAAALINLFLFKFDTKKYVAGNTIIPDINGTILNDKSLKYSLKGDKISYKNLDRRRNPGGATWL